MTSLTRFPAKVLSGGTVSNILDLRDYEVVGIHLVGTITSVALSFESAANTEDTPNTVKDSGGAAVSLTVASNTYVGLTGAHAQILKGLARTRVIFGSAEGADRTIYFVCAGRS